MNVKYFYSRIICHRCKGLMNVTGVNTLLFGIARNIFAEKNISLGF